MPSVAASGGLDTPRRTGSGGRRPIASRSGENDSRPSERRGHADGGYAGGTKTPRPYGGAHRGGGNSGGWWERSSSSLPPKMPRAAANEAIQRADAESLLRWVRSHGASVISLDGLKDGVALCEVIQRHDTGVPFTGLNRRAKSRAAVLANLELALQVKLDSSKPSDGRHPFKHFTNHAVLRELVSRRIIGDGGGQRATRSSPARFPRCSI